MKKTAKIKHNLVRTKIVNNTIPGHPIYVYSDIIKFISDIVFQINTFFTRNDLWRETYYEIKPPVVGHNILIIRFRRGDLQYDYVIDHYVYDFLREPNNIYLLNNILQSIIAKLFGAV